MKRLIALMFLLICTTVIPVAAQDAPPSRPPCAADEVTQIADIAGAFGDQLNAILNKDYDQTLDGDTAKLLDWLGLYESFLLNEFPGVPDCVDGVVFGNTVGITLNQQVTLQAALVLDDVQQAANTDDADLYQALSDLVQVQSEAVQAGAAAVSAVVNQMQTGVASPEWLPTCTADQLKFNNQLDEFEQTYASLQGGLQAYLDTGAVDKATYFAVIKLTTDMAVAINAVGADVCADYYFRALDDAYKFGDTFTALTLGQAAPAISGNDQFDAMHQWMNAFVDPSQNCGI
jgi:hypothetical protein